jgi:hypothetical protein
LVDESQMRMEAGKKRESKMKRREGGFEEFHGALAHYDETRTESESFSMLMRMYYQRTKAGLVMLGMRTSSRSSGSVPVASESESRYDPPILVLPADPKVGDTWSARSSIRSHSSTTVGGSYPSNSESDSKAEMTQSGEIVGKEELAVARNQLSCRVIRQETTTDIPSDGGKYSVSIKSVMSGKAWFAPSVGFVKVEMASDSTMRSHDGKVTPSHFTTPSAMTEYHLEKPAWGLDLAAEKKP